jgi:hypothetical protein
LRTCLTVSSRSFNCWAMAAGREKSPSTFISALRLWKCTGPTFARN